MDLNLKDTQLDAIISKAILDSLSTKTRQELITKAVTDVLQRPTGDKWSDNRSRLQKAFDQQVEVVASKLIRDELAENSEFKAKVKGLFEDVSAALFDGDHRQSVVEKMVETIVKGLNPRDY